MSDFTNGWHEDMTLEETKNLAYWERNMLALLSAKLVSLLDACFGKSGSVTHGWYRHNEYNGWTRVISIANGRITFHVPDNFDLGDLPEIEPNWNGHTTAEKWEYIKDFCGVKND